MEDIKKQGKFTKQPTFSSLSHIAEEEELRKWLEHAPPFWKSKKMLSKQLSMRETPRDEAWERRRRQMLKQESTSKKSRIPRASLGTTTTTIATTTTTTTTTECTDEDLSELRGSIELGFGFDEEGIKKSPGKRLCNTLPALDLYFAVNRKFATSPIPSPSVLALSMTSSTTSTSSSCAGAGSSLGAACANSHDSWKICCPGDNPQQVKTRLRHWAQAVACSVRQAH